MSKQLGAVVVFKPGVNRALAEAMLATLRGFIEPVTVHEFDPDEGGPVWYIP